MGFLEGETWWSVGGYESGIRGGGVTLQRGPGLEEGTELLQFLCRRR